MNYKSRKIFLNFLCHKIFTLLIYVNQIVLEMYENKDEHFSRHFNAVQSSFLFLGVAIQNLPLFAIPI